MDGLQLPIDPRTLEASVSSRKLRAIDEDGSLIYEEQDSSDNRLTERLGRIWDEYPNGLFDLTDARLASLDPEARAIEDSVEPEEDEEEFDRSKAMTYHDMQRVRDSLCDQLNTARNELWFALELAKTLSVSSEHTISAPPHPHQPPATNKPKKAITAEGTSAMKVEPPILPGGSYTATPATIPPRSTHAQVLDYELALAAKHRALEECTALIDAAVDELQVMSQAGDRFWNDIRQLKDGQGGRGRWAIVPKPDFTRTMAAGEKAKDVVIPYAIDEAASSSRVRCLAAFDLDPTKPDPLTFGSRGYRRLRVTLQTDDQAHMSTVMTHDEDASIHRAMEAAQLEALDEDLYVELQNEVNRLPNGIVSTNSVALAIGNQKLIWEMYDTRTDRPHHPDSPVCDAIVLAARMSLMQLYRRRKLRLVGQTAVGPPIYQPIVQMLQFHQAYRAVQSVLEMHLRILSQADIEADITVFHPWADDDASMTMHRILSGQSSVGEASVLFKLDVTNCRGITISLSVPAVCRVTTSVAEFAVPDLNDLASILAEDLAKQILLDARRTLAEATTEDVRNEVFLDELEGVVRLPPNATLQVSIPPPYNGIRAFVTGSIEVRYDPADGQALDAWLGSVASKVSSATG